MNLAYELEKHGISLVSIKENIDPTTKSGKMIGIILTAIAFQMLTDGIKALMPGLA